MGPKKNFKCLVQKWNDSFFFFTLMAFNSELLSYSEVSPDVTVTVLFYVNINVTCIFITKKLNF